jgi:hypothetical protein
MGGSRDANANQFTAGYRASDTSRGFDHNSGAVLVMNEFAVDTKSSQFKAPFNEINNEHRVSTPEDTAVITPNSDTPYSGLICARSRWSFPCQP